MDDLRLPAVAARLVAWHNRHPLARRIGVSHVHAIGYVALPCVGGAGAAAPADEPAPAAGGSLRERAQARARQQEALPPPSIDRQTLQADFSEDFIDPLKPRQVARFALRAGQPMARAPNDGPLRQVRADGGHPGRAPVALYLLTAVIETGTHKSRVLLGGGATPEVLGRRVWSRPRLAAVGGTALLVAAALYAVLKPAGPAPAATPMAAAPAASVPAGAASVAAADEAGPAAASAAASAPLDVEPRLGHIDLPPIQLSEEARNAARQARPPGARVASAPEPAAPPPRTAAADAHGPAPAPAQAPPAAAAPPARPPAAEPAAPPPGAAYALSTRPLRTRAEADQVRVAMQALLKTVAAGEVRVDVLPEGEDWRVVGMPFASRAAADKARALLVSRGMRVEVVGF